MKKITLFAVAALAASTALAVGPRAQRQNRIAPFIPVKAQSVRGASLSVRQDARSMRNVPAQLSSTRVNGIVATADPVPGQGDAPVSIYSADFREAQNCFYSGLTPGFQPYLVFGFTGIRNTLGFANLTEGADSYEWNYSDIVDYEPTENGSYTPVTEPVTETTPNLYIPLEPFKEFNTPVLTARFGTESINDTSNVRGFMSGMSPYYWGLYDGEEGQEFSLSNICGLYNCAADFGGTLIDDYCLDRTNTSDGPADPRRPWAYYNKNGVYGIWDYYYTMFMQYLSGNDAAKAYNSRLTGLTTVIPAQASAYQLGHMWPWVNYKATADFVLTATVHPIDNEGNIDYDTVLGEGSVSCPAVQSETDDLPVIEFQAMEDGLALDFAPSISAGSAVAIRLSGFDSDAITAFYPVLNTNTNVSADAPEIVKENKWPIHAYANVTFDYNVPATDSTEVQTGDLDVLAATPLSYGSETDEFIPSDFMMFFNIEFPVVLDPETGKCEFSAVMPAEGGSKSVEVDAIYDLQSLLADEVATINKVGDWFDFTAGNKEVTDEDGETYSIYTIDVTAQALPEGVKGREGYIVYQGYGCDFFVTVTQGEVPGENGIGSITAAAGSRTEYYDMQGRRLSAAPARGLYIERCGSSAVKRMAR